MKKIKISKLLFLLIVLAIIMDFVPVKMAKKMVSTQYNDDIYVCKYVTATDGNWLVENLNNPNIDDSLYINVEGKNTFNSLKEISNISIGHPVLNMYIFQGEIDKRKIYEDVYLNWLQIKKWEIVYPIKRQSLRELYVPKSYLTIYDFNWVGVLRSQLGT